MAQEEDAGLMAKHRRLSWWRQLIAPLYSAWINHVGLPYLTSDPCVECGADNDMRVFMLRDLVWYEVMGKLTWQGHIHLRCAEKRLGRPLVRGDFDDAPCNERWVADLP